MIEHLLQQDIHTLYSFPYVMFWHKVSWDLIKKMSKWYEYIGHSSTNPCDSKRRKRNRLSHRIDERRGCLSQAYVLLSMNVGAGYIAFPVGVLRLPRQPTMNLATATRRLMVATKDYLKKKLSYSTILEPVCRDIVVSLYI